MNSISLSLKPNLHPWEMKYFMKNVQKMQLKIQLFYFKQTPIHCSPAIRLKKHVHIRWAVAITLILYIYLLYLLKVKIIFKEQKYVCELFLTQL